MADVPRRQSTSSTKIPIRNVEPTTETGEAVPVQFVPVTPEVKLEFDQSGQSTLRNTVEPGPDGRSGRLPRLTRLLCAYVFTGVVSTAWLVYCVVRYIRADQVYATDALRHSYASAFASLSLVTLSVVAGNLCIVAMGVKFSSKSHGVLQSALFVASACALFPAIFNIAVLCLMHGDDLRDTSLSLQGRCTIDSDLVWSGKIGGCANTVPWGMWLAVAIVRLVVTFGFLLAFHLLTWTQVLETKWQPSISTVALVASPGTARPSKRPRAPSSIAPDSVSSFNDHRRTFSSSLNHATNVTYVPHHLLRPSPAMAPVTSFSSPPRPYNTYVDEEGDDSGDLNRFAATFRTMVERVSRETEAASVLSESSDPSSPRRSTSPRRSYSPSGPQIPRSNSIPSSSSSHRYYPADLIAPYELGESENLQRRLLNAHQIMLMEQAERSQSYEHIIVLGNPVRRMSTIPSLADSGGEPMPWTPSSETPTFGPPSPRDITRSPTSSSARSGRRNGHGKYVNGGASASIKSGTTASVIEHEPTSTGAGASTAG